MFHFSLDLIFNLPFTRCIYIHTFTGICIYVLIYIKWSNRLDHLEKCWMRSEKGSMIGMITDL